MYLQVSFRRHYLAFVNALRKHRNTSASRY